MHSRLIEAVKDSSSWGGAFIQETQAVAIVDAILTTLMTPDEAMQRAGGAGAEAFPAMIEAVRGQRPKAYIVAEAVVREWSDPPQAARRGDT